VKAKLATCGTSLGSAVIIAIASVS